MIDCHTHTHNSPDSECPVEKSCQRAIDLGLEAFAITDHCEVNRFYSMEYYNAVPNGYDTFDFGLDFEKSMNENLKAKEIYKGKLNLLNGIELGQATADLETAEKVVNDDRLDFIIGSMHQIDGHDDFAFIDYSKEDVPSLLNEYYLELLKLCKWGKFDVLGHLTYTLRYIEGLKGYKVDMSPYNDTIRECFKELISKDKGIEINTSGLRQAYGDTFPKLEYVKMFREMGGEILSLGSDAHTAEDISKGIKEGIEIARQAGFKRVAYFKNRKPYFINI